jgi:dihydroorotase
MFVMTTTLITNAKIVNEGCIEEKDIFIRRGRIERIGTQLNLAAEQTVDAKGKYLLPGMIDDQVHFREPGLTHKGDIQSESRAAVAGGITSYMEMPNVNPVTTNATALRDKLERASQKSMANFAFYLGASNDNLENIQRLDPNLACGVKVFMGASTGNMLVDDPVILERIFADCPVLIATHCEDTPMILANEQRYRQQYGDAVPIECHPDIRSEAACYQSSSMAVDLAKRFGTRLHVLHITTEKELSLFSKGPIAQKQITAEACVHHLYFNEADYQARGTLIKCNPAIKGLSDQQALLQAVKEDVIDIIATDHAPHTLEEKQGTYFKAPAGLPLVQYALVSALEHVHAGFFSLEKLVEKISHNVATRFQIKERGFIREGYWADLVLVDLAESTLVSKDQVLSKCGWSPFEGVEFASKIISTWVNGVQVFAVDTGLSKGVVGQALMFDRGV